MIELEFDNVIVDDIRHLVKVGTSYYVLIPKMWLRGCGLPTGGYLLMQGTSKDKKLTLTIYNKPEPIEIKKSDNLFTSD